jgi:hypothetical protein
LLIDHANGDLLAAEAILLAALAHALERQTIT